MSRGSSRDGVTREVRAREKQEMKGRDGVGRPDWEVTCPGHRPRAPGRSCQRPSSYQPGSTAAASWGTHQAESRWPPQGPRIRDAAISPPAPSSGRKALTLAGGSKFEKAIQGHDFGICPRARATAQEEQRLSCDRGWYNGERRMQDRTGPCGPQK